MSEQEPEETTEEYNPTAADVDPIPAENQVLTGDEDDNEDDGELEDDEDV